MNDQPENPMDLFRLARRALNTQFAMGADEHNENAHEGNMKRRYDEAGACEAALMKALVEAQADVERMNILQSLVENPSHHKEGVTICTKWPGGVMVINPADIRAAIDVIRGVVPYTGEKQNEKGST